MLDVRARISEVFLTVSDEEMYARVLEIILEALESPFGVFGYIDENGALVVPTMTRTIWTKCQVPEKAFVFPRATWGESIWPRCIKEKRTLLSNDPSTKAPAGHVPIRRNISSPIIHRSEVVGLLQVANKRTAYTPNDIRMIETIGGMIAPVLVARLEREQLDRDRAAAEEALRLKNLVFDRAIAANSIADTNGVITEANDHFLRIWGYADRSEVVGRPIPDFLRNPEEAGAIVAALGRTGQWEGTYTGKRKDGSTFAAYGLATTLTDASGRVIGYQSSVQDVTERKRGEEEIALNEYRGAALLKLNDMVTATEQEVCDYCLEESLKLTGSRIGYLAFLNGDETVLTMNSWSKSAMRECAIADKPILYPVAETGLWGEAVRQRKPVITNDYAAPNPLKKGLPAGHVAVTRHMNVPVVDGGKIVVVAGVGNKPTDYTETDARHLALLMQGLWRMLERRRALEQLRNYQDHLEDLVRERSAQLADSEERFRTVADFAHSWEYWLSPERSVLYSSPACERITGYGPEHFTADATAIERLVHPEDAALFRAHVEDYHLGPNVREDREIEFRITDRTGKTKWIGHACRAVVGADGIYRGRRVSNREITERKAAEEAVTRLNRELAEKAARLEASNAELESFAYSVSHDLRAPLRTIDGFSAVLIEDCAGKLAPGEMEHLQRVRSATTRMAALIDDLLKLSRISRVEMARQRVGLGDLARAVAHGLRSANPEREAEFAIDPGLEADGDERLLRVLLENLLGNAWKFTGKKPFARIEFGSAERNGERVWFVRDDGAGFDMTYAGKLFAPFQRLHATTDFPGTGIGLATAQRVVHRHGGRIWAEGEAGRGACFYFTLGEPERSKN